MTAIMSMPCSAVDAVCREGPARVMELVELGTEFTKGVGGQLHLTRGANLSGRKTVVSVVFRDCC